MVFLRFIVRIGFLYINIGVKWKDIFFLCYFIIGLFGFITILEFVFEWEVMNFRGVFRDIRLAFMVFVA